MGGEAASGTYGQGLPPLVMAEPCQNMACCRPSSGRWRVSVGAEPPNDRGVQEQAARLNRLGVPLCDACGLHLGAERL